MNGSGASRPTLDANGIPADYPFRPAYEISPRAAHDQLAKDPASILLVDVRTQEEWDLVHIPGSIHIPLHELESRIDEIEPEAGKSIVTICHHGVRSLKASLALRQLGVEGAMSVAGGIELWSLAADASVPRYERGGGVPRLVDMPGKPRGE